MSSPQQHQHLSWEPITLPTTATVSEVGLRIILAQQQHIQFLLQQLPSHQPFEEACPTASLNMMMDPINQSSPPIEGAFDDSDEGFEHRRARHSKRTIRRAASMPWDSIRDLSKGGRPSGCSTEVVECIRQYMSTHTSYTQQEVTQHIAKTLGVNVSRPTVCRWMQRIRSARMHHTVTSSTSSTGSTGSTSSSKSCNNAIVSGDYETDLDDVFLASTSSTSLLSSAESITSSTLSEDENADTIIFLSDAAVDANDIAPYEIDDEEASMWHHRTSEELQLAPMMTFEEMVWELELDASFMLETQPLI